MSIGTYEALAAAFAEHGLLVRGGFVPEPADGVADFEVGRPAAAVVIVGNAGPDMWRHFAPHAAEGHGALDRWTRRTVDGIASRCEARAVYPFDDPPPPFLRWARRAEDVAPSPIGILIHPDYGLWHAYRAALLLSEPIDLPPRTERQRPCESCAAKPCLTTCPVSAFHAGQYDVRSCTDHLDAPAGHDCLEAGCRARTACPVGKAYLPEQARFHMAAFQTAQSRRLNPGSSSP